ncbi:MAG: hypothetical protein AB1646_13755 [Thermodesulfobacteriota bacterium]
MEQTTEIEAVEMVRRIRDQQTELLEGKSHAEVIAFFAEAAAAQRKAVREAPVPASEPQERT